MTITETQKNQTTMTLADLEAAVSNGSTVYAVIDEVLYEIGSRDGGCYCDALNSDGSLHYTEYADEPAESWEELLEYCSVLEDIETGVVVK